MIKKYRIVSASSPEELAELVNKLIEEEGWQPFGSLALNIGQCYDLYCQPMVELEEKK